MEWRKGDVDGGERNPHKAELKCYGFYLKFCGELVPEWRPLSLKMSWH